MKTLYELLTQNLSWDGSGYENPRLALYYDHNGIWYPAFELKITYSHVNNILQIDLVDYQAEYVNGEFSWLNDEPINKDDVERLLLQDMSINGLK